MKTIQRITFLSLVTISIISCNKKENHNVDPLITNRDTTINPSEDFFKYANNGWFKQHPIPSSEKSNGIFRTIQDTINNQIKSICIKSAEANADKGSNKQKIGDFYASGMDSITIDKVGISPLKSEIAKIDAVTDLPSLLKTIAYLHTIQGSPAFGFYVGQDDKISSKNALFLAQGGLGLGQRDYYFENDDNTKKIRAEYPKHVARIFELTGDKKKNR